MCLAMPYKRGDRYCQLCLSEKVHIARSNMEETREEALNKRSEIMAKCRHILPRLLNNFYTTQHHDQPVPTIQDLPDPGQQEDQVEPSAGEQEPPPEPPDQGEQHSDLVAHGPQGADVQPGRRLTRSMARKENP